MGVGAWLGSTAAIIVMLVVLAVSLVAFRFWIKQVQFGAARAFVVAVMPASVINVVVALALLLATPGGLCNKSEMAWFLVTPFVVYSIASLCSFRATRETAPTRTSTRSRCPAPSPPITRSCSSCIPSRSASTRSCGRFRCETRQQKSAPEGSAFACTWWSEGDLNPRHADFQSAALPTELPDHIRRP